MLAANRTGVERDRDDARVEERQMRECLCDLGIPERGAQWAEQFHACGFRGELGKNPHDSVRGGEAEPPGDFALATPGDFRGVLAWGRCLVLEKAPVISQCVAQRGIQLGEFEGLLACVEEPEHRPLPALEFLRARRDRFRKREAELVECPAPLIRE